MGRRQTASPGARSGADKRLLTACASHSTGNPIAVTIMAALRERGSAFYRFKRFIPNREHHTPIWQHHADVYEGGRRRDGAAACAAIVAHMDFNEEKLAEGMSEVRA